jgi:hypothetical protein
MLSHTERGKAFQVLCRDALKQALKRDVDMEVPIDIGGIRPHFFDLATPERDVVAECKAFTFTASGNNPTAKITAHEKRLDTCLQYLETSCACSS